jgi:hypothetical protein
MSRLVVLAALALAACVARSDDDCFDVPCDQVCTREGECLPADEVRRVQVRWTIRGEAADATRCEAIASLEIHFLDRDGDPKTYVNVPCGLGLFTVDRQSARFDEVELIGLGSDGQERVRGSAAIEGADAQPRVDLIGR